MTRPTEPRGRAAPGRCVHCGLPVPPGRRDDPEPFCCNGCAQAYRLLHDWGLDGYYALRERQGAPGAPARTSGRSFAAFDDPAFLERHARELPGGRRRIQLYLEGVHCAACVWVVESLPRAVEGLVEVRLNFATHLAEVDWDPAAVPLSAVARALDAIGYSPHPRQGSGQAERQAEDRALLIKLGVASACAMNIMLIHGALYAGDAQGMSESFTQFFRWVSLVLSLPVMLFSAPAFFRGAWAGLRQRLPHMDLPVSLALLGAFAYSAVATVTGQGPVFFDSLTALVALLLGARYLQQRAQRLAIERHEGLRRANLVEFARRLGADGVAVEVPAETIAAGDRLEVRPGELIPVDGVVLDGRSTLDQAVLTGEPEPIPVSAGERVFAGATNLGAPLTVRAHAVGAATRVGALLALVDEALAARPPIVQLADRWSRIFVVAVLALAALTGAWALLGEGLTATAALERVVALLVVTCPCALGLATPVAMTVGLMRAARAGIFVKNPGAVERLPAIRRVLLDKTGTLTEGAARVVLWDGDATLAEQVLALEAASIHPIAQAFRRSWDKPVRVVRPVDEVNETAGAGIEGRVDGRRLRVGRPGFVAIDAQAERRLAPALAAGLSPVLVEVDGALAGVAGIGDRLRADAAATVAELSRFAEVQILSGDHPAVVARVAASLGLPPAAAHGGLSPEAKRDRVAESTAGGWPTMMIGDGVNDAAALALGDVGVAVHGGTGASQVAADVLLTRAGLAPVLELFTGGRRLLGVVRRNLIFSLVYNLCGASLAFLGLVGPLGAALLMPMSSLTVILSSMVGPSFRAPRRRGA